ncbi:MAG: hypothetical protein IJB78_03305 [Oscillospiraceae bacterium]|nr:hypothetical protein [Oscillospiraceae bacterium]
MQNFENIGRELERRGKTDGIRKIAESADGQSLSRMIDASAVEQAAKSGDTEALKNMVTKVLSTDEGKRLAESLRRLMQD